MNRRLLLPLLAVCCLAFIAACQRNHVTTTAGGATVTGDKAAAVERLRDASQDVGQLMKSPDAAIPQEVLESAKCVAIVPDMVKGGFIAVGAQHGRGVATCRTGN